ncbi:hypothetical protein JVT61DRAFT_8467 [Boletus reticuloceps]|uniref:Uncharacterized protein n=1 Tax=Boletus reticuloceps TaxID=495285 RepID=A0A8I2YYB7_9AGAM|nr:hypothetical protein JVT61DRAFT_8467 [Boletus reticuloceps]
MVNNGWQQNHVDMHVHFWSNIENHEWRYSRTETQQRALMHYQGNQHRFWHATIGGPQAFNLSLINQDVLSVTHNRIVLKLNNEQYKLIRKCSLSLFSDAMHHVIVVPPTLFRIHGDFS